MEAIVKAIKVLFEGLEVGDQINILNDLNAELKKRVDFRPVEKSREQIIIEGALLINQETRRKRLKREATKKKLS